MAVGRGHAKILVCRIQAACSGGEDAAAECIVSLSELEVGYFVGFPYSDIIYISLSVNEDPVPRKAQTLTENHGQPGQPLQDRSGRRHAMWQNGAFTRFREGLLPRGKLQWH